MSTHPDGSTKSRPIPRLAPVEPIAPDENPLRKSVRELIVDLSLIEDVIRVTPALMPVGGSASINPDLVALEDAEERIVSELRLRAIPLRVTSGRLA